MLEIHNAVSLQFPALFFELPTHNGCEVRYDLELLAILRKVSLLPKPTFYELWKCFVLFVYSPYSV